MPEPTIPTPRIAGFDSAYEGVLKTLERCAYESVVYGHSIRQLAGYAGLPQKFVAALLLRLERAGVIEIERMNGRYSQYRIVRAPDAPPDAAREPVVIRIELVIRIEE